MRMQTGQDMRFLITGARGQVATEVTRRLSLLGIDHVALSRRDLDITSEEHVREALVRHRPQAVINCAAYNQVDRAESEPGIAYAINSDGPEQLAAVCKDIGSALVHFSTDYVFDGTQVEPYDEDAPTNPLSVYGKSKLAGELAVLRSPAPHLVLRVSWVFGRLGTSFADDILKWASSGTLRVVDDQRSVPCDASGLAAAVIEATRSVIENPDLSGLYHFAMGPPISRHEFAEIIMQQAARFGIAIPVPVLAVASDYFESAARRPENSALDGRRFERRFGIESGDWKAGLQDYFRELAQRGMTPATATL
jgi:dTDP-4-dehydrorhamnose reductase